MRVALLPVADQAHVREMVAAELVDEGSVSNHMPTVMSESGGSTCTNPWE